MRSFAVFALLALSAVNASYAPGPVDDDPITGTQTLTSTTTKTVTVTECNPDKPDCPWRKTTSTPVVETSSAEPEAPCSESELYPVQNTTIPTGPTASVKIPVATKSADSVQPPPAGTPAPSRVVTNGAGSMLVNGGLLLGAFALGFVGLN